MRTVTVKSIENEGVVKMYTLSFVRDELSEFEKFVHKFRDNAQLKRDYQIIIIALTKIASNGALERYFRPEGKMNDNVCALPVDSGKLRLYCLRISDHILIIGNGGVKSTKTYQDSNELRGYVLDLQKFDAIIKNGITAGTIVVQESDIDGLNGKIFEL